MLSRPLLAARACKWVMNFYSALVTAPEGNLLKLRFLVSSELAGGAIGSRQIICEACAVQVHRHVATALMHSARE